MNSIVSIGATIFAPKLMEKIQHQKVTVVHAIPGRVRLQCDRWKNKQTAENLMKVFQNFAVVKNVETSAITGSLMLEFHVKSLTQEQFDHIVKSAVETSVATYPELESDLMGILKNVIHTIDSTMKKQIGGKIDVTSLLSVVLIINGILKLPTNPTFSSSLLYWAYTIITKTMNGRNSK